MPKCLQSRVAATVIAAFHSDNAQSMGRRLQNVARSTTFERSAEVGEIELSMT